MFGVLKKLFGKKREPVKNGDREDLQCIGHETIAASKYTAPLKLCIMGDGSKVNYTPGGLYGAKCLWWVSEETDGEGQPVYIRESKEKTVKVPATLPFMAAGKHYLGIEQLYGGEITDGITTDVHGRQVLCYRERFPCFDSYDYLHEHRYYRWFFLKGNGRLTRVYTADESGWIFVTEDAENVENQCTELLRQHGWAES